MLVQPDLSVTFKVSMPKYVKDELDAYAKWAGAKTHAVADVALQRLFDQDEEWKQYRTQNPQPIDHSTTTICRATDDDLM